jgi:A/G-specific adenine glycosylase
MTFDHTSMRAKLLEHFDAHRRVLPWRENVEPYGVWVSEIMLQQARVETATPYYVRWMERFPSVTALAEAGEEDVLKAWEGLGYYSRARNLHRSAGIVKEDLNGVIPGDAEGLRELPGIGEYSAGAIASICYGEPTPAVDGNARRVISRLFDLPEPSPAELRERANTILETRRPGDWNQAIMELGATICLPRSPRCEECPVAKHCQARASGTQEQRPLAKRRSRVREASFAVLVAARRNGELLLTRRPSKGLLGGLWEFPSVEVAAGDGLERACRGVAEALCVELPMDGMAGTPLQSVEHVFSHLKAEYRPLLVTTVGSGPVGEERGVSAVGPDASDHPCRWVAPDQVVSLPLPVAQRKILALARAELGEAWAELVPAD